MNHFFCMLHHTGFLTIFVPHDQDNFSTALLEIDDPVEYVSRLHFQLKDGLDRGVFKTETTRKPAERRLARYQDLIILFKIADQILISSDIQIPRTESIIFRTREELFKKLGELKPHIPMGLITKLAPWLGWPEIFSFLAQGFTDGNKVETIIIDNQTGRTWTKED